MKRVALSVVFALSATPVFAVNFTFYNFVISGGPLGVNVTPSTGSLPLTGPSNAISFSTPNAIVGDNRSLRSGSLTIQYDAFSSAPMVANEVRINLQGAVLGSGTISFREDIWKLDANGNEVAYLGFSQKVFNTTNTPTVITWSDIISFAGGMTADRIRAKKSFEFFAPDTQSLDLAAIGSVNQSLQVVPEPATMTALALGAAALMRRRKKA